MELLTTRGELERDLGRFLFHCKRCNRQVHWVSGVGADPGHWSHAGPSLPRATIRSCDLSVDLGLPFVLCDTNGVSPRRIPQDFVVAWNGANELTGFGWRTGDKLYGHGLRVRLVEVTAQLDDSQIDSAFSALFPGGAASLAEFWNEQHGKPGLRGMPAASTLAKWETVFSKCLADPLGATSLSRVTRQDVKDLLASIRSPWQAAEALKLLRMLLNRVIDAGEITANVAVRIPAPRMRRHEIRVLKPSEVTALAAALPDEWRAFVLLGAYSSLRWSELVALRRDDLDLQARTVRVDERVTEVNGRFEWGRPKTESSERTVDLPNAIVPALAEHLLAHPAPPNGLIFHGETGEPVRRKTFRRVWLKAVSDAGIEDHVRVEWLRHSGASLAYAASKDLVAVSRRLGHTSTRMVDGVYVKLYEEIDRQVADAIDAYVGSNVDQAWTKRGPRAISAKEKGAEEAP
jgi:integrase